MIWALANMTAGVFVSMLVAYLLGAHGHRFNLPERIGMGLMGAGSILTIGPILKHAVMVTESPFDDWSSSLLRIGCMLTLAGVIARLEGYAPAERLTGSARLDRKK